MAAFMLEFGIFLIAMQCSYIVTAPAKALDESNSDENDRIIALEEISQEKQNPILVLYPLFPEETNLYDSKIFSINQPSFSAQNSIQPGDFNLNEYDRRVLDDNSYISNSIGPDQNLHGRFKRSPYYNYGYSYYGRRGYGRGYGYGSRYGGGCYNCGYRPGRAVGAALLVGGAAFTGGFIGSRIGK